MIDSSIKATEFIENDMVKLKQHLRNYLDDRGITAAQLARKSGVSKQVISTWLNGVSPRRIEQVKKVADVIGITVDELCFGASNPESLIKMSTLNDEWLSGVFELKVRRLK